MLWSVVATPFTAEMTDYFAHPELADGPQYPEGYGLVAGSVTFHTVATSAIFVSPREKVL